MRKYRLELSTCFFGQWGRSTVDVWENEINEYERPGICILSKELIEFKV